MRGIVADLSFLDNGKKYIATIYGDANDADWQKNQKHILLKILV